MTVEFNRHLFFSGRINVNDYTDDSFLYAIVLLSLRDPPAPHFFKSNWKMGKENRRIRPAPGFSSGHPPQPLRLPGSEAGAARTDGRRRERSVNQGAGNMRSRWVLPDSPLHTHRAFRHASFLVILDYGLVVLLLPDGQHFERLSALTVEDE